MPNMKYLLRKYSFSNRTDNNSESIDTVNAPSRLTAAKHFASRKNLPLKSFLKIFKVSK